MAFPEPDQIMNHAVAFRQQLQRKKAGNGNLRQMTSINLLKISTSLRARIHKLRGLIEIPVADAQILGRVDVELGKLLRLVPTQGETKR
jgi:hypothetical protein